MDKQERGMLLADQEELEKKVASIKKKLIDMGTIWKTLSNVMTSKPEEIIFSNAPSKYGSIPMDLFNTPSFNWEEIPKLEIMAQLIQELRAEQSHLEDVQLKLRF